MIIYLFIFNFILIYLKCFVNSGDNEVTFSEYFQSLPEESIDDSVWGTPQSTHQDYPQYNLNNQAIPSQHHQINKMQNLEENNGNHLWLQQYQLNNQGNQQTNPHNQAMPSHQQQINNIEKQYLIKSDKKTYNIFKSYSKNGDQLFFFKTNIYKCFKYTRDKKKVDRDNFNCVNDYHKKNMYNKCGGRITFNKEKIEIEETQPHSCLTDEILKINNYYYQGIFEIKKNICVLPGLDDIMKISYCIYIEYNIKGNSEKIVNFVGTQEYGVKDNCKEQIFNINEDIENIENIEYIVVWSKNRITRNEDEMIYQSRIKYYQEVNNTIILNLY